MKALRDLMGLHKSLQRIPRIITKLKYIIGGGFKTYYEANDDGTFTFDLANY